MAIRQKTKMTIKLSGRGTSHARSETVVGGKTVVIDEPAARGGTDVPDNRAILVQHYAEGIIGVDIAREAVLHGFLRELCAEGAEQPVPDNQGAAVITVEIAHVGGVVYTVVRGRIENELDERVQSSYRPGMDPELVEQADADHGDDHGRLETEQRQGQPEQVFVYPLADALAQCRTKVHVLRRVMVDVPGPEQADFMVGAVKPVVGEIVQQKQQQPGPPLPAERALQRADLIQEEHGNDGQ